MQSNPLCLSRLDRCLFLIHHRVNRQCANTRKIGALMREVFADGRVDGKDYPLLVAVQQLATDEHDLNLETDELVRSGQEHMCETEDLLDRWAKEKAASDKAARQDVLKQS